MIQKIFGVWALAAAVGLVSTAIPAPAQADSLSTFSDSGIRGPAYEKIESDLVALAAKYPNLTQRIFYGVTVKGRNLNLLKIARKDVASTQGILVSGSIHGNEYLNIEDRMAPWLLSMAGQEGPVADYLAQGGVFYVIPIMNPDGYAVRQRENAHGKDINRDFTVEAAHYVGFKEPEIKQLHEYLDRELGKRQIQLKFTLDYHCCSGALLYPWSFNAPAIPELGAHRAVGEKMKEFFGDDYQHGTTPEILGYEAIGTSKDHYYERYGSLSFTFEGAYKAEQGKFAQHQKFWLAIIESILNGEI